VGVHRVAAAVRRGDRIEIAGQKGDVIDQRLFQFTLNEIGAWGGRRSEHRPHHSTSRTRRFFTDPVANYDKGFKYIWNEVPVVVTYESNWQEAREVLTAIAFQKTRRTPDGGGGAGSAHGVTPVLHQLQES